jgi:hypothetical protein
MIRGSAGKKNGGDWMRIEAVRIDIVSKVDFLIFVFVVVSGCFAVCVFDMHADGLFQASFEPP